MTTSHFLMIYICLRKNNTRSWQSNSAWRCVIIYKRWEILRFCRWKLSFWETRMTTCGLLLLRTFIFEESKTNSASMVMIRRKVVVTHWQLIKQLRKICFSGNYKNTRLHLVIQLTKMNKLRQKWRNLWMNTINL